MTYNLNTFKISKFLGVAYSKTVTNYLERFDILAKASSGYYKYKKIIFWRFN